MTIEEVENQLLNSLKAAREQGLIIKGGKIGAWAEKAGNIFEPIKGSSMCVIGAYLLGKERTYEDLWRDKEAAVRLGLTVENVKYIEYGFDDITMQFAPEEEDLKSIMIWVVD